MPRKAAAKSFVDSKEADSGVTDGPRRSTRISSQPGQHDAQSKKVKGSTVKKTPNIKKRSLNEEDPSEQTETTEAAKPKKTKVKDDNVPVLPSIDIGDSLPSLTLKNEQDEDVQISALAAEKGVILFLVPKADTPGCTTQACGFRDMYPDFSSSNFDVYCLSADNPSAQSKWQAKKTLPYPLISDPNRVLIQALTGGGTKTARSHFIFEKGGVLVEKKLPVKPADSSKLALEFVQGLSKGPQSSKQGQDDAAEA